MKWDEVRKLYPNQWVKIEIVNSHTDSDYLYIDEMNVMKPIEKYGDKIFIEILIFIKGQ